MRSRIVWGPALVVLGIGCGARSTLLEDSPSALSDGGPADGPILGDGPIVGRDGPIITPPDGPITGDDGPIAVEDGPIVFQDGPIIDDGGFRGDAISFPPDGDFDVPIIVFEGGSPDGGTGEGGLPVFCGTELCGSGADCCVTFMGGGGASETCVPAGTCDMGVSLACTGSDNCSGGDVCCGSFGGFSAGATCTPGSCDPGTVQLCNGDGDCPMGESCDPTPIGLNICRHHH
jgi:hypothetical protein